MQGDIRKLKLELNSLESLKTEQQRSFSANLLKQEQLKNQMMFDKQAAEMKNRERGQEIKLQEMKIKELSLIVSRGDALKRRQNAKKKQLAIEFNKDNVFLTQPFAGIADMEPEAESETNSRGALTIATPAKIEPRASAKTLNKRSLVRRSVRRDDPSDDLVDIRLNLMQSIDTDSTPKHEMSTLGTVAAGRNIPRKS